MDLTVGTAAPASVVLDLDQTLLLRDRQIMIDELRRRGAGHVAYHHSSLAAEPLLALPDIVAWCWARGGDWRRRVGPVVAEVRRF